MAVIVHDIDPVRPEWDIIDIAAAALHAGKLVVFPTSGLYGLGGDAFNPEAVGQVFKIKNRSLDKPLLVLISHRQMLSQIVEKVPSMAAYFMDRFWPGKVTLVMEARKGLPHGLCSQAGKVGVRWVAHPVAAALVNALGRPIIGTSANLTGAGGCASADQLDKAFTARVDMVLNAGVLRGSGGSSVVDVTGDQPRILRQGVVPASVIVEEFERFEVSHIDNSR